MTKSSEKCIQKNITNGIFITITLGAIGSPQPFLGSLGAGAGGPGSHHAMQKPTWSFFLVAYDTLFCT
jgi:hypothetical protein